jgi:hypothetical protein
MESSSKSGNTLAYFIQQMISNKFLLLTVVLAVGAAVYFIVGISMLLSH